MLNRWFLLFALVCVTSGLLLLLVACGDLYIACPTTTTTTTTHTGECP